MDPILLFGAVLGVVYLIVLLIVSAEMWERGIGAKIYLIACVLVTTIAGFTAWHDLANDPLSIALEILFLIAMGLTFALLGWVALASMGIIGDGGFVSELVKAAKSDPNKHS